MVRTEQFPTVRHTDHPCKAMQGKAMRCDATQLDGTRGGLVCGDKEMSHHVSVADMQGNPAHRGCVREASTRPHPNFVDKVSDTNAILPNYMYIVATTKDNGLLPTICNFQSKQLSSQEQGRIKGYNKAS
ncbi:hypothetical protein COCVIDRAFT_13020 [Bipolaris victoriae FI3]|uniref:Uncharacterized protein n=1 Tax=Bipolaris victoriae (strain FI3) TaxID=930091 RepID=W7F358_BIPV3|nr:hypothetical protein COCVIDRAFT_13020 [Bipolaris victoriae FI3]